MYQSVINQSLLNQSIRITLIMLLSFIVLSGAAVNQSFARQATGEGDKETKSTPAITTADMKLYDDAIARMLGSDYQGWRFQQIAKSGNDIMVEHFDSTRPADEQWTLIRKNGNSPNADDIQKYQKDKREMRRANEKSAIDESNNDFLKILVKPGTLRVTERNADRVTYSFRPRFIKDADKVMENHVFGTMTVAVDNPWVEQVYLFSLEEFKTGSAHIREFQQKIDFAPVSVNDGAPVFYKKVHMKIKGRTYGLFDFDKNVDVDFSEYQKMIR